MNEVRTPNKMSGYHTSCHTNWLVFTILLAVISVASSAEVNTTEDKLNSTMEDDTIINLIKCNDFTDHRSEADNETTIEDVDVFEIPSNLSCRGEIDKDTPILFRLKEGTLNCGESWNPHSVKWEDGLLHKAEEYNYTHWRRSFRHIYNATKPNIIYFTPDGHFLGKDGYYRNPDGDYCVKSIGKGWISLQICSVECDGKQPKNTYCLPKCCAIDEVLFQGHCIKMEPLNSEDNWSPNIYQGNQLLQPNSFQFYQVEFPKNCSDPNNPFIARYRVNSLSKTQIRLASDSKGNVRPEEYQQNLTHDTGKWEVFNDKVVFCADAYIDKTSSSSTITPDNYYVFYCILPQTQDKQKSWTYTIFSLISVPFLLATVVIYFLILDKLNLHGLTILCYASSELMSFSFLIGAQLIFVTDHRGGFTYGTWPCYLLGVSAHFFYFASQCWLTVMNFDLYLTFKMMRAVGRQSKEFKKFVVYSAIGWGLPMLTVMICMTLDKVYRDRLPEVPVPDYAKACFVAEKYRDFYVHLPAGIVMGLNVVLIFLTVHIFWRARKHTNSALPENNASNQYSAKLFAKLFVVMGGSYLIGYVTWYFDKPNEETPWAVVVFESISFLTPIFLFVIFCLNIKTLGQLQEKFPQLSGLIQRIKGALRLEKYEVSRRGVDAELTSNRTNTLRMTDVRKKTSNDSGSSATSAL